MKRAVSVIMVIMLMAIVLSGCGGSRGSEIIGQWYNSDNKCLDIRNDGTYKLEGDYGTGTWKVLDDSETIEFIDFYGDTQESKILSDEKGEYIDFGMYGNYYRNAANLGNTGGELSETSGVNADNTIYIEDGTDFKNDLAFINYADGSGLTKISLVNTDGKAVYTATIPNNATNVELEFEGEVGYYSFRDDAGVESYVAVNSDGEEIGSSISGDFNVAIACGNGLVFVYKNESDYAGQKHLYGFLDRNGNWSLGPYEPENLSSFYNGDHVSGKYLGCGMFCLQNVNIGYDNMAMINSATGVVTDIENIEEPDFYYEIIPEFANDVAIIEESGQVPIHINGEIIEYEFAKIKTDGSYLAITDIPSDASLNNNIFVYKDRTSESVVINDLIYGKKFSISDYYNCKNFKAKTYGDGIYMLTFQGADSNYYFSLVSSTGKEIVSPVQCSHYASAEAHLSKGIVFYVTPEGKTAAIDTKGNVLFEGVDMSINVSYGVYFYDGIAHVTDGIYINTQGEQILQNIEE